MKCPKCNRTVSDATKALCEEESCPPLKLPYTPPPDRPAIPMTGRP